MNKYYGIYKDKFGQWKVYLDENSDIVTSDSPDVVKSRLKRVYNDDSFMVLKEV